MAWYMFARWGARMSAQCLRMELEMPEGPGALYGLIFNSVAATRSGVNFGNEEVGAVGGCSSTNWCSSGAGGWLGEKRFQLDVARCRRWCEHRTCLRF